MSSFQRCCDPLKCHTRKRTRNARSDLRPVSNKLVETFPQLMLNPSQKVCLMCRRKLYAMQNSTSSVLDLSGIVPQSSSENSNLADTSTSGVRHVDQDQFTLMLKAELTLGSLMKAESTILCIIVMEKME